MSTRSSEELDDKPGRVVDVLSGEVVGWELRLDHPLGEHVYSRLLEFSRRLPSNKLLVVRVAPTSVEAFATLRGMRGADPLNGVAFVVEGSIVRETVILLEHLRERGARLGCDSAASMENIALINPDLLWLSTAVQDAAGDAAFTALTDMAATIGARVLASHPDAGEGDEPDPPARALPVLEGLARLADPLPALPHDAPLSEIVDVCLRESDHDWVVLLDARDRPDQLIERAAVIRGEPFEHPACCVGDALSLAEVARIAVNRPVRERLVPLALVDDAGRYRGLVRIDRLLGGLAD